jgi:hypothetical protein
MRSSSLDHIRDVRDFVEGRNERTGSHAAGFQREQTGAGPERWDLQ